MVRALDPAPAEMEEVQWAVEAADMEAPVVAVEADKALEALLMEQRMGRI